MRYIVIFVIIILFGIFFAYLGIYQPIEKSSSEIIVFLVEKGQGAREIAMGLREEGLIRYSFLFRLYVLIQGKSGQLKAGEYELSPAMNIPEIVNKFVSGEVLKKTITIIEGWANKDIQELLGDRPGTVPQELEGYLFPDTYEVLPEDSIEEIVEMMLDNFDKKVRSRFSEELSSNIIIMASLLEKEVKTIEDKKIVAGILWKRLEIGMLLQVDATIPYYDTYKYQGLPPIPICNPGLESIKAAIYPQESQYWYYLSAPDGKTIFSKTLQDHNLAKAKYLK